ncbi:phosphonate ABC transporter substrate-binding protein [Lichenibacterium ramalinae]|uniref:Phosphonate ABC transporter substrate-binding protein n=1 Tax=Lichenibacterium ramalinae TaxID=2316527 RepID=A0A4Q2RI16_9HYPH|nr:phosphonate ABC transporter substrate-binding protein [Lichenibacterium ramalinae]RYB07584.1 phosphonate ABC transporter substrate-binding protein [Lichenibacterium ramalinae]
MLTRRHVLGTALAAAATAPFASAARAADDWRTQFPEIVFAVVPAENASGVTDRYAPFVEYLSKQLGVKVTLRIANDYAALIEGQRAGNIQVAYYGPASFARALVTGVKVTAFAIDVNNDGSKGYYSVFYVLADSPYKTVEDLKGKALGLVDPNSTSGYNMPLFALNKMGIDPKTFFSNVVLTGSHENAVIALSSGQVQAAANFWMAPGDSNLTRMLNKGMLKKPDGSPMKESDFRIVLKSDLIINDPTAYLDALPEDMKAAIRQAFFDSAAKAPEAFAKLSDGKNKPFAPTTNADYDDTIKLIKFVDNLKKKG